MELACIAVRLGVDFRGRNWEEQEPERAQVERHMRLCLTADSTFSTVVTIAPSEPLLAEAAFLLSTDKNIKKTSLPNALLAHIDSSYLAMGDRGELVAALLVLLARDAACLPNYESLMALDIPDMLNHHKSDGSHRIVSVVSRQHIVPNDGTFRHTSWPAGHSLAAGVRKCVDLVQPHRQDNRP